MRVEELPTDIVNLKDQGDSLALPDEVLTAQSRKQTVNKLLRKGLR